MQGMLQKFKAKLSFDSWLQSQSVVIQSNDDNAIYTEADRWVTQQSLVWNHKSKWYQDYLNNAGTKIAS